MRKAATPIDIDGMTKSEFEALVKLEFAPRLKEARVNAGFQSAAAFARALGIEAARYRHWERGHAPPDIEFLAVRLCPILGVNPSHLLPRAWPQKSEPKPVRRDWLEIDETAPPVQRDRSAGDAVPSLIRDDTVWGN